MRATGLSRGLSDGLARWRAPRALKAIRAARAAARERAWALAGQNAPGHDGSLVTVHLDATIVIAHSEKDQARPPFHPPRLGGRPRPGRERRAAGDHAAAGERRLQHGL